jgi:hypothetical protein
VRDRAGSSSTTRSLWEVRCTYLDYRRFLRVFSQPRSMVPPRACG